MATKSVDFPRGGESTALPQRKRKRKRENQDLFKTPEREEENKKRKTFKHKQNTPKSSTPSNDTLVLHKKRIPGWIHAKNVSEDTLVLGIVKEFQDLVALVSLPYNLIGRLDITDVSSVLSESILEENSDEKFIHNLFHKDQLIVCQVKQVGKSSLGLTCDPSLVNRRLTASAIQTGLILSGVVTSKEDHGYQISFGVEGRVGFLLNKRAKSFIHSHNEGRPLSIGQVVLCCVESGGTRAVPVSIDIDSIISAKPPTITSIDDMLPFQLVECAVKSVFDSSLLLEVSGGFSASCAPPHLKNVSEGVEGYSKRSVKGRVIWVQQDEKQIGVSLKKSLLQGELETPEACEIGQIFEDSQVLRSEVRGLFLKLADGKTGFCPLKNISDEFLSKPGREYRSGTNHACRVVYYNSMDEMTVVSLRKSVIEEKFLNFEFVRVGDVIKGKILAKSEKGLLVSLSPHVKGFCPKEHYFERKSQLKYKHKKLEEGCMETFRVLKVEAKQRLTLTHKKALVTSTNPILSEYSEAVIGGLYHGYVVAVLEFGCVVRFFQQVKGILHKSQLQLMPQQEISELFYEGQVLECRVISCEPAEQKLVLTLATNSQEENVSLLESLSQVRLTVGGISPHGLELFDSETKEKAALPIAHLSDYKDIQRLRFKRLERQLGTDDSLSLDSVRVFTQSCRGQVCVVSMKESVERDIRAGIVVQSAAELEPGLLIHGVVKRVDKYGFLIAYPGDSTGLLPNRFIKDEFVQSPVGLLQVGDTVLTKVMEVNEGRFVVSARDSDVISQDPPNEDTISTIGHWFREYLSNRDELLREASSVVSEYRPGQVVDCTLIEKREEGTIVSLGGETNATAVGTESAEFEPGEECKGCVLGVSACPDKVFVTLNENLVESYSSADSAPSELVPGSAIEARIELVQPQYMVGIVGTLRGSRLVHVIRDMAVSTKSILSIQEQYLKKRVNVVVLSGSLECGGESVGVALGVLIEGPQLTTSQKKRLVKGLDEIKVGAAVTAQVKEVQFLKLKVRVGGFFGRILASEISDSPTEGERPTKPFKIGDNIKARIIAVTQKKTTNVLKREYNILELSLRTSKMNCSVEELAKSPLARLGDTCYGCVEEIWPKSNLVVNVSASISVYVPLILCSEDADVISDVDAHFKLGQVVSVELLKQPAKNKKANCTLVKKRIVEVGSRFCVQIQKLIPNECLLVSLPFGENGRIEAVDLADSYCKDMTSSFEKKQIIAARVVNMENDKIFLSTRNSCLDEFLVEEPVVMDRVITSIHDLTKGEILRGFVKSATDVGVFIKLGRSLTGRVRIKNLSDQFIKDFKSKYIIGKLVKCKVMNINAENGNVDLSLRLSHTNPEKFAQLCLEKGAPNKKKGIAKLKKAKLENGEAKENLTDDSGDEQIGDVTKVRGIEVEHLSSSSDEDMSQEDCDPAALHSVPLGTLKLSSGATLGKRKHNPSSPDPSPLPRLEGTGGFKWEWEQIRMAEDKSSSESESENEESKPAKKKTKRQKRAAKRREEESIYTAEQGLLNPNRQPETAEDFDRLLLANPNSSYLWIQYSAYQLHLANVEKAREMGRKALETINFRMEDEKLNVWIALLNLENIYGNPDTLNAVFQDALKENDAETLYFKLAHIYTNSNKSHQAEETFETMTRKFKTNPKVWKEFGQLLMETGKIEEARKLCEKALQKLPQRFHTEILTKFGQFEFKFSDPERGRTIFESLINNYPKRVDIWFVYIDTLLKFESIEAVRELFERGTSLKLSVNQIKAFYKKFLTFEKKHGSEQDVERVMESAREFVEDRLVQNTN